MSEQLTLKWGTLKGWHLTPGSPAMEALKRYHDAGPVSMSAMGQRDNADQKQAICDLIDALDNDKVYLDWDGEDVSKEDAKAYIMEYPSRSGAA